MEKQLYSFLHTSLITFVLIAVAISSQKSIAQTYSTPTHKPLFTENRKMERINNLEAKVSKNLLDISRQKQIYIHLENTIRKVKKRVNEALVELTLLYTEDILTSETSYDPKMYAASIKSLRDALKKFLEDYRTMFKNIEKKIATLERENLLLQNEIDLLRTSKRKQISTHKVHGNEISDTDDYLDSISTDKYLDEIDKKTRSQERNTLSASTENSVVEPNNYYKQKCPQQNPGDTNDPNRFNYKFDTNNNPNDGDYVLCRYWNNGDLDYEIPYANNKKHGISYYNFRNTSNTKWIIPYTNGKKDGTYMHFLQKKGGGIYKWKESEFSGGHIRRVTVFREDGSLSNLSLYSSDGKKKIKECWYPKNGPSKCKNY